MGQGGARVDPRTSGEEQVERVTLRAMDLRGKSEGWAAAHSPLGSKLPY